MKNEDIIIGETYRIFFNRRDKYCRNCSKIIGLFCENCSKKIFDGIGLYIAKHKDGFAFLISDTEMVIVTSNCIVELSKKKLKIRKAFVKNFLKKLQ